MSPPWLPQAIELRDQGFNGEQIAIALGRPRSTVNSALWNAGYAIQRPLTRWVAAAEATRLRDMVEAGISFPEIARQFGTTKNAVVGAAWRAGLCHPKAPPHVQKRRQPQPVPIVASLPGAQQCVWPIGDLHKTDFRWCSAEIAAGAVYCAEHAAIAYMRPKETAA